jgi:hypothetical protein
MAEMEQNFAVFKRTFKQEGNKRDNKMGERKNRNE